MPLKNLNILGTLGPNNYYYYVNGSNSLRWTTLNTTSATSYTVPPAVWNKYVYLTGSNVSSAYRYIDTSPTRMASPAIIIPETDERKAAIEKAWHLLKDHLNDNQRKSLDENKFFLVKGGKTGTPYRIRDNGSLVGNIDVLNPVDGNVIHRLCAHGEDKWLPMGDQLFIQKVMLELNEENFVKVANVHPAR